LHRLWHARDQHDEYIGTLVNAYIAQGGRAYGVRAGRSYVDVGTLHGYREAIMLLSASPQDRGADNGSPIPIPRRLERLRNAGEL
jgi:glucose-1-phosphate thymidylyltransferase